MDTDQDISIDQEFISRCFDLDHLTFLIGTGLSKEFGGPTMADIAKAMNGKLPSRNATLEQWIKEDISSDSPNVEKFLDKLYLRKRYYEDSKHKCKYTEKLISITRAQIFDLCSFTPKQENLVILFLFLNTLINRKSGLARVNLFTLNYDLLIETCCDTLGILLNDGFDGTMTRWLNPSQFDMDYYYPSGIVGDKPVRCERVMNYFKLHGSLNWVKDGNRIVKGPLSYENMIIYPCLDKFDAMAYEPFAEIFRRFSVSIKRLKGALIVVGYSFCDPHINQIILQALEQPSFRMVVVNPDANCIDSFFPEAQRFPNKVRKLIVGFKDFVEKYLPSDTEDSGTSAEKAIELLKKLIGR